MRITTLEGARTLMITSQQKYAADGLMFSALAARARRGPRSSTSETPAMKRQRLTASSHTPARQRAIQRKEQEDER